MPDIHSVRDADGAHNLAVWYDAGSDTEAFYQSLEFLVGRYRENDTVVALDLKNEPHGAPDTTPRAIWNDSADELSNWKYVAEQGAARVLAINPNLLIVIEGIETYPKNPRANADFSSQNRDDYHWTWWGGNLRGVRDFPVDLGAFQHKVVYSPHDYGPSVGSQPWFGDSFGYASLYREAWRDNWLYIHTESIAPLFIGEWGGPMEEPTLTWMTALRTLIIGERISHTFWCLNPNSGDTGGLLLDDFKTWDGAKYEFLRPALWQKDGRFVSLDAAVPLGAEGMTRTEYFAQQ
jgi:aryl-phospho-beta-D-glucosidase BglC (GH1 family)